MISCSVSDCPSAESIAETTSPARLWTGMIVEKYGLFISCATTDARQMLADRDGQRRAPAGVANIRWFA